MTTTVETSITERTVALRLTTSVATVILPSRDCDEIQVPIDPKHTISRFKENIRAVWKPFLPTKHELICDGVALEDQKKLSDYPAILNHAPVIIVSHNKYTAAVRSLGSERGYTVYEIQSAEFNHLGLVVHRVQRRFRHFMQLVREMVAERSSDPCTVLETRGRLPKVEYFGRLEPSEIARRERGLQQWLRHVAERYPASQALQSFLTVPHAYRLDSGCTML